MILEILLIISLFLWLLSLLPIGAPVPTWGAGWLAWITALLLTLIIFVPALRG